jgi:hypothetical protein
MDNGNSRINWIVGALLTIGVACWGLAGVVMDKLQSGQSLPIWVITIIVIGAFCFIISLLLLIPKGLWNKISPWAVSKHRKEHQLQQEQHRLELEQEDYLNRCLPKYVIHEPTVNPQPVNPKDNYPQYTARFRIEVTNQPDCIEPIIVHFNAQMRLDQVSGYGSLCMDFMMKNSLPNDTVPLQKTQGYDIDMIGHPCGTSLPYLDLSQLCHWKIEGVTLHVFGLQKQVECHNEGYMNAKENSIQSTPH